MRKLNKIASALILMTALMLGLSACQMQGGNLDTNVKPVLGLSFDSLVVERWQRDMEIIVAEANEMGYEVNVQIANEDLKRQQSQIEGLVDAGVKALIVLPNDASGLSEAMAKAQRAGIPVIAYDRLIKSPGVDYYISFDNEGIGYQLADRMIRELMTTAGSRDANGKTETKNIIIINGDPKDNNAALLNQGFNKALRDQSPAPIKVIHEVWANGWRERYAEEAVREVLSKGIRIDGVICANDMLAATAVRVLAEANLAGQVPVVSQDAELSACQRIIAGTQLATVYKPINDLASQTVKLAVALSQGPLPQNDETIFNGYHDVPYQRLEVILVDRENIDSVIIESGFHQEEDVYRFKP